MSISLGAKQQEAFDLIKTMSSALVLKAPKIGIPFKCWSRFLSKNQAPKTTVYENSGEGIV
jgi:hypothetical protein